MTQKLLLPNKYKKIGWIIFIPALILGVIQLFFEFSPSWLTISLPHFFTERAGKPFHFMEINLLNTIVGVFLIIGGLLVGFSKERNEDEFIEKIRLSSLLWAVWVNYLLLLLAFLFVYDFAFITVMIYNMFTVLLIFILRFNFILYKNTKSLLNDK